MPKWSNGASSGKMSGACGGPTLSAAPVAGRYERQSSVHLLRDQINCIWGQRRGKGQSGSTSVLRVIAVRGLLV